MTATPTPGDLSVRHVEVLRRMRAAVTDLLALGPRRAHVSLHEEDAAIDAAIAALSALPAAGGEESSRTLFGCAYQLAGYHDAPEVWLDRLSDAMQGRPLPDSDTLIDQLLPYAPDTPEKWDGHTHVASEDDGDTCEVCGRNFRAHATTPQPSAAEEVEWDGATRTMQDHLYLMTGERDRYKALHEQAAPTIARMERRIAEMDAAVGAQGDGEDRAYWMSELWNAILRLGGKHKEELLKAFHRAESAAPAAGKSVDDAMVERFCAAFFTPKWPTSSTHNDNVLRGMVRPALEAALTRQPVAGDGKWFGPDASGGYYVKRRAEEWFYARPQTMVAPDQLAAPAATPTDGGEGKS